MERSAAQGIQIRQYQPGDAAALYSAARESVTEIFPWLPWCHPDYAMADAERWACSRHQLFAEGKEYTFVIVDSSGRFLGAVGVNQFNRDHQFANLGYWVRSSECGRGVAAAAVRQAAEFAFSKTDLLRLEIVCAVGNVRSQRVAEKSGALREGILRHRLLLHGQPHDAVMYSIVKSRQEAV